MADKRGPIATRSSLRAEADPRPIYAIAAGAGPLILLAAFAVVVLGPVGFALLALLPAMALAAWWLNRKRTQRRSLVVELARTGERLGATVTEVLAGPGVRRGGQEARRVRAALDNGRELETLVFWTAAAPGVRGLAVTTQASAGADVGGLLYFASGPTTLRALEQAFDRETAQHGREPLLADEPLLRD